MLQTMRQLAQSWVFKGLMLFLVISFSIWEIGDIFHGNPLQRQVARIGKVAITVQALDRAFSQALERAHQQLSPDLNRQQAMQMGMLDDTLSSLIERAGLEQDVEQLGINVSEKEFLNNLATMPQFIGEDGKFNKMLFLRVLQNSNMSERDFFTMARTEMAQQQLFNVLRRDVPMSRVAAENLYRARAQKRVFDVVTVKDSSFANVPAPDDKTLNDFYNQESAKFMAPEYRAITIARLSVDDVAKDVVVTDDDIKKEYDAKSSQLATTERRDVTQVVLQDETKAKQLTAAAKASGNLAAAAKYKGLNAVSLDRVEQKGLLPGLTDKIFTLANGEVSNPIQSGLGWHVVQVKKIYPAGKPNFDAIKEQLRTDLQRDRAIDKISNLVNELDDQLAAGHALEDIAEGMKLRLVKIPAVDSAGLTPDGKQPAELPDRDIVLKAAFAQNSGDTSPVLDDKQGNYAVVRTEDVTPGAVPPLEKIKDRVIAEWTKAEGVKRATKAAEDIAKGLRDGKTAASFAGTNGVDVRVSKPISLAGDSDPDLPQTALPQILKLKKDEVTVIQADDSQIILRLTQIIDADPAANKAEVDKIAEDIKSHTPSELAAEYVKFMRVLYPVDINQSALDGIRQEGG